MDQQNRRNFLYSNGKTAPSLPNMGKKEDQTRAAQWVNPYEFYSQSKFWEEPGRNFSPAAKAYYENWLETLKGQKNVRPTTISKEDFEKLRKSITFPRK